MNRKNKRTSATATPDEHIQGLDQLLTQLKKHLTASAGAKGSYGDYLRLLEFYSNTRGAEPRRLIVSWVDSEQIAKEPAA